MAFKVYLLDAFADLPGTVLLESGNITVQGMIDQLASKFGPQLKRRLQQEGLAIYLNGNNITFLDGMETIVRDGDEVVVAPFIAGG